MKNIKTLKFWAEWCKPCTALAVQLEGLEMTSYNIDLPESAAALKKYRIKNIPALVFVEVTEVDGKEVETEVHRHLGMFSRQAYLDIVDALAYEKINPDYQEMVENLGSPREEERVKIYTQVLDFSISPLNSLRYLCDGKLAVIEYGTNQDNIQDFVRMLNESPQENGNFNSYGLYVDNGDGRVRLEAFPEVIEKYCPNGEMSLQAFWD
jgi:thiol-disulfide isomerase/thioredoxin